MGHYTRRPFSLAGQFQRVLVPIQAWEFVVDVIDKKNASFLVELEE